MKSRKKVFLILMCLGLAGLAASCGGGGGGGGSTSTGGGGGTTTLGPVTLTSLNPIVAMQNGAAFTLTATGTGFASGDQVMFNGAAEPTTDVDGQHLTAQIPTSALASASAATGFAVTIQSGSNTSAAQQFYVVPAISPNPVTINGGSTTSGVNITVPTFNPPSLQLQDIGGSASGTANSAGVSAVVASAGSNVNLFIVGNGLVAGTFYEVTGSGVTVTQPLTTDFSQTQATKGNPSAPAVNFNIAISSNATPGPRNLIVTNPAGEISIYPGGIVITPGS